MTLDVPRPQPLGALPWPAGMLLVPDVEGAAQVAADLAVGRDPQSWPVSLSFLRLALAGDVDGARAALAGDDAVARYNAAVLVGGDGVWESLDRETDGELQALVRTAAFSVGVLDAPPATGAATGEIEALVGSARASACLEVGDAAGAADELAAAVTHAQHAGAPLFAASLALTRVEIVRDHLDDPALAAREADLAVQALPLTAPSDLRAELQVQRALSRQLLAGSDRGALLAVVADLQEAVRVLREDTHPAMFATINQHLALAYLMMPMGDDGDRIRLGTAVTSLRAALRVLDPEHDPVAWSTTQLNLANALQYLPSVHQEDNLDEAVQLYEEVLQHRDDRIDPIGVARVLVNQSNALAHLGAFLDAREKLATARELFASRADDEGLAAVAELLAEIDDAETRNAGRTS